jgi:hypothetical protein
MSNLTNGGNMALKYDYTALDTEGWTNDQHNVAANFVWPMMYIDMKDVTKENADEIIFRFEFLQRIGFGPFTKRIPLLELKAQVRGLIGYKTNVKQEPRFKFIRRWMKTAEQELQEFLDLK